MSVTFTKHVNQMPRPLGVMCINQIVAAQVNDDLCLTLSLYLLPVGDNTSAPVIVVLIILRIIHFNGKR